MFVGEGGEAVLHGMEGVKLNSGGIRAGELEEATELEVWVSIGDVQRRNKRDSSRRELPRASNLEQESSEHRRWTHLEQMQHCTVLPL